MFPAALSGAAVFDMVLDKNTKICYNYDGLNRVTERTVKNATTNAVISTETFTYDAAGNITGGSADDTFVYDTNNLVTNCNRSAITYNKKSPGKVIIDLPGVSFFILLFHKLFIVLILDAEGFASSISSNVITCSLRKIFCNAARYILLNPSPIIGKSPIIAWTIMKQLL